MDWLRTRPYAAVAALAFVALVAGGLIVYRNTPVTSQPTAGTWSGKGLFFVPTIASPSASEESERRTVMQQVLGGAPYTYIAPTPENVPLASTKEPFDLNAFISLLSSNNAAPAPSPSTEKTDVDLADLFSLIPASITAAAQSETPRTPEEAALYAYGNEAGVVLQAYEEAHRSDAAAILQAQADDRTDPVKAAALRALGSDLSQIGYSLQTIENVPTQAKAVHDALAESYIEAGQKLAVIADATGDEEFVAAVLSYGDVVNTLVKKYVELVHLFGSWGVRFSSKDPGSVFTFNPPHL